MHNVKTWDGDSSEDEALTNNRIPGSEGCEGGLGCKETQPKF